jgi:hypothetical protein
MLVVPWVVVGDPRTLLAQSALPDAPQEFPRPTSRRRRRWFHRISKRRK